MKFSLKVLSVALLLFFSINAAVHADGFLPLISLGTDPANDASPNQSWFDILETYYTNNGTHFRVVIRCRGVPDPSKYDYHAYLDIKPGGDYGSGQKVLKGADYVLSSAGILWEYTTTWIERDGLVAVQVFSSNKTVSMTVRLSDLNYPEECVTVKLKFSTHSTPITVPRGNPHDVTDTYNLDCSVIPEQWWLSLLIGIPALAAATGLLVIRKYGDAFQEHPLFRRFLNKRRKR